MRLLFTFLLFCGSAAISRAQFETLLVPPAGEVQAGRLLRLKLYLNNPAAVPATFRLPPGLTATFASATEQRRMAVVPADTEVSKEFDIAPRSFKSVDVTVIVPDTLEGNVSLRLDDLRSNPIMFKVAAAAVVRMTPRTIKAAEAAVDDRPLDLNQATAFEQLRRHLLPYEPIYFALGANEGLNARFQFSFKFRLVSPLGNTTDLLHDLYFGYTQTSLWDLKDESKPFYDTSYKPALFYYHEAFEWKPSWIDRMGLQVGARHESNGQAAKTSRSLNTVYAMPILSWVKWRNWKFSVAPRAMLYLEKGENPDLPRYRGYVEWLVSAERGEGFKFTAHLRKGAGSGYGSAELNASWPLEKWVNGLGGRLQIQYFNGWGESLLDYNKRRADQVRLGFMLVP